MRVRQTRKARRWDVPFGDVPIELEDVEAILEMPVFEGLDARGFPDDLPLDRIISNDARIVRPGRGDAVYRQGEFGTSVFIVLRGRLDSTMTCSATRQDNSPSRGRRSWRSLSRVLPGRKRKRPAETHGPAAAPGKPAANGTTEHKSNGSGAFSPPVLSLGQSKIFGALGAFNRRPRNSTVVSVDDDTILLEIRWPGVRDMLAWSETFRTKLEEAYAEWGLWSGLQGCSLFKNVDDRTLRLIAENATFERYDGFEWSRQFQKQSNKEDGRRAVFRNEPIIAEENHYLDGVLLIHTGFVRVTEKLGREERTVGYATKNTVFGLSEIAEGAIENEALLFRNGLRAAGYVDLIRIPTEIVEAHLLPTLDHLPKSNATRPRGYKAPAAASVAPTNEPPRAFTEFLVDNRFLNGAIAMAINTDRCVNCDDCVRACAAAHDGSARFIRKGATHRNLMVVNACMHCTDPVCLIDCPTAAIHRDKTTGNVVINDATCIGCAACAEACPYNNIQMAELRDSDGAYSTDEDGVQILRAEKCDLCAGRAGGPACERVCPHDALIRVGIRDTDKLLNWLEPMR